MISIVIPLYNKETYIRDTLNMILSQTFQTFEIIVIDDGSTDNGPSIISEFTDNRIKFFSKENGGVSSARNMGIKKSSYNFIAFLDADDYWENNHLEEINKLIEDFGQEADVFVTGFARKYPDKLKVVKHNLQRGIIKNYFKNVLRDEIIHTSCVCIRKDALFTVGLFNTKYSHGEDIDLWNRLARRYKIAYNPIVTEVYLVGAENNSSRKINYSKVSALDFNLNEMTNIFDFIFNLKRYIKICIRKKILK